MLLFHLHQFIIISISLIENRNNPKCLWQVLKSASGEAREPTRTDELIVDGSSIGDNDKATFLYSNRT